jgi:carbamoyltransferase
MKPNEHEYKLMGLAPYGREEHGQRALKIFRETLQVDGIGFSWNVEPTDSYFWFRKRLEGVRFDNIAWALQAWTEELILKWVRNCIMEFDIKKVVLSGGVAMNIKAMGRLAELPELEDLFVGGSAGDESLAIGSAFCLAEDLTLSQHNTWHSSNVASLPHLNLGPQATEEQETVVVEGLDHALFSVERKPRSHRVAQLLAEGHIVARCAGRMEFGQRALGNRSILADPSNPAVKERINAAIKNRDFWMPFAPVILDTYVDRYLDNSKGIASPHMTIGYQTTDTGYEAMKAACHPADRSARPQILHRSSNPELYELLEQFAALTGRGALLNTSFNLHGYPIVNTPADAIHVFVNSDLDGLLFGNYLVLRRNL